MPISSEQWRVATGLINARHAACPARSAASPRKYLSRGTLFLRACMAVLQVLLILTLNTDCWGPCVKTVCSHNVREPVEKVVTHLRRSRPEGQSSVRFYVPALRILLIISGDVEQNPGPPKPEGNLRPTLTQLVKEFGSYPHWDFLGLLLGIEENAITSIKFADREMKKQCWKMFRLWLQKTPTASWVEVCNSLEKIGDDARADSLREKYCPHTPPPTEVTSTDQTDCQGKTLAGQLTSLNLRLPLSYKRWTQSAPASPTASSRQFILSDPMDEYASFLKSAYIGKKSLTNSKWPPSSPKKYFHFAVVKKEWVSKQEADEFTRTTFHGNLDDILHQKEPLGFSGIGKRDDGSPAKFILIEGAPGIGKTTVAWKICRKWAKQKILTEYKLVVLLRLRDKRVRKAKRLFDLLYHPDPFLRNAVSMEIKHNKGRSLFLIFEGYDELPRKLQTESSIFLDILYKDFLPEATVLVTSRPIATKFLHQTFREQISQHIEILGFTKDDIQCYIHSVVDDPQVREDFICYLNSYPYIRGIMYVPLNAGIVTETYKSCRKSPNKHIPTTMTDLYTTLTRDILLRYLHNHSEYGQRQWTLHSFSDLPQVIYNQFCRICSLAFNELINNEFIFDDIPQDFDTLDLMQSSPELYVDEGALTSHKFFHLTLQEYLAAVHISNQKPEEQIEYFQGSFCKLQPHNRGRSRRRRRSLPTILPTETANHIFPSPVPGYHRMSTGTGFLSAATTPQQSPRTQRQNSDDALYRPHRPHTLPRFVPTLPPSPAPGRNGTSTETGFFSATTTPQQSPKTRRQNSDDALYRPHRPHTLPRFVPTLPPSPAPGRNGTSTETGFFSATTTPQQSPKTRRQNSDDALYRPHRPHTLPRFVPTLPPSPAPGRNGTSTGTGFFSAATTPQQSPITRRQNSDEGLFHSHRLHTSPRFVPTLSPTTPDAIIPFSAPTFRSVEIQTAQRLQIPLRFVAGLRKFENLPLASLKSLVLKDEQKVSLNALHWLFEAQCIDTYSEAISGTTKLEYQRISGRMTPFDCFVLGHAVSNINCVWTINLFDCQIGNEGLEMVVAGMHYSKSSFPNSYSHLPVSLDLSDCDITPEGLYYLTKMPEHVAASITKLDLGYNPIGGGASHFFSYLPALRSLKTLSLYNLKVTTEDIKALAESLSQPASQQLEVLNLNGSSLNTESTAWMLAALPHNTTLKELHLWGAHICMENVSSLTTALRRSCGLKILSLRNCKIDPDTACEIASVLYENSTLEKLHMRGNPIGPRGAAAFADMLKMNRTLRKLNLSDIPIGKEGAYKLTESLFYNSTLKKLWIPETYKPSLPPQLYSIFQNRLVFL